jgi:Spx/MgsR family transcriptional regulator
MFPEEAMVEIYVHPTCTSCRKAEALLAAEGVEATRRDYFKERFSRDELSAVFARAGVTPNEVISRRSTPYRELHLAENPVDDDALLDLMVQYPNLIRRPLIITDHGATVGFNADRIQQLIADDRD